MGDVMSDISNIITEPEQRIILYTSYYRCNSTKRQEELNLCLQKNSECKLLDTIILVCEDGIFPNIRSNKITTTEVTSRKTYRDIFNLAEFVNPEGWNIFCNSDIYLTDESIQKIKERIPQYSKNFLALTRWEDGGGMMVGKDSQDTWAWFGKVPDSITRISFGESPVATMPSPSGFPIITMLPIHHFLYKPSTFTQPGKGLTTPGKTGFHSPTFSHR